ncbi:MAG: GspH/FimT family pseudopilin, partial [Gammaproteobacteria bacterium]|nr:GspH/FimT family pseudopilin [Gammaproteobacteria bacterium]
RGREQRGYTLVELVIVVTVLGVIAAIAVPSLSSSSDKQLDLAAQEFAAAMRFARSESIRTGEPHGFRQQSGAKRIRVFHLDTSTSPGTLVYDVYHPVDKQLYDIDLNLESLAAADSLNRTAIFRGACNQQGNIYFDASGTPWCADPETVLLDTFEVDLVLGSSRRTVALDDITGRVTVR